MRCLINDSYLDDFNRLSKYTKIFTEIDEHCGNNTIIG